MEKEKQRNIYEKLLEVRKSVPFLKKDNDGQNYKYVSSSQTLSSLREAMDLHQLLLIPKITGTRFHRKSGDEKQHITEIDMLFTWVNIEKPEEHIKCAWYGQGVDSGEKGVGKALTYAEKYFLLKFFNIATDKDDPDANQSAPKANPKEELKKATADNTMPKFTNIMNMIDLATNLDALIEVGTKIKGVKLPKDKVKLILASYKTKKDMFEAEWNGDQEITV